MVCRLQKFKLGIANTVISQENTSMATMATDQLLNLFSLDDGQAKQSKSQSDSSAEGGVGLKQVLQDIGELWDEKEYDNEFDLKKFMNTLKK